MATACPCCGAISERQFLVDLATNTVAVGTRRAQIGAKQAEILFAISEAAPGAATIAQITGRVWQPQDEPDQPANSIKAQICYIRKALAPLGLRIAAYGSGYRLEMSPLDDEGRA